jgi:PAS domain-containing protein
VSTEPTAIIETTVQGIIEWVDEAASQLLNLSHRACRGRELLPWFAGDRHVIAEAIYRAAAGQDVQGETIIRPRDRKPLPVSFHVALIVDETGQYLRWTFSRQ